MAASGSTGSPNYLPYPLDTDPVDVAGDVELLALQTSGRLNLKIDNVTTTLGDTIYTSANGAPGTIARLAGNTSATRAFLGQTGTGSISAAPSWTSSTGTGNVVLATSASMTSPTITTPIILDIQALAASTADLWSEVTTGSITIGAGLTTGTLNIAAAGTGATTINLGHTNATLNIVGTIDLPIISAVALGTNASGVVAAAATSGTGSTIILQGSPTITQPTIDSIINTSTSTAATYFNGITTGSISTGSGLTTGSYSIANGTAIAGGSVNIASGAGTGNKTVAIGTSATSGTTAITIGSNSGATSTIALNGTVTVGGDMTINGTLTTINSNSLTIDDKNIELGSVTAGTVSTTGTVGSITGTGPWTATITGMTDTADLVVGSAISATNGTGSLGASGTYIVASIVSNTSITYTATGGTTPTAGTVTNITTTGATDITANGGGVILKGTTDKTILWDSTNTNWTSSEHLNLVTGKVFKINNVQVLSNTAVLGITPSVLANGFSIAGGTTSKTLTVSNTITLAGTDGSSLNIGSGGTLGSAAFTASTAYISSTVMTTLGDILYGGASGAATRLAGNTTTTRSFLGQTGDGTNSAAPSWTSSTGTGNVVLATSATLTTPTIDTINISGAAVAAALWNTTLTTGSASIAGALTTGSVNIATGTAFNGTVNIATGAGTVNKTINIGTASTSGTTAINLGSSAGAITQVGIGGGANANESLHVMRTATGAEAILGHFQNLGGGSAIATVKISEGTPANQYGVLGHYGVDNSFRIGAVAGSGGYLSFHTGNIGSTNLASGERMRIDASGRIGFFAAAGNDTSVLLGGTAVSTGTSLFMFRNIQAVNSTVTSFAAGFENQANTQAASFTLGTYAGFRAQQGTFGVGSAVTNQSGFDADSSLIGATNNYGFRGRIASGTNRWNIFMDGSAANYLAGQTTINSTSLTLGNNGTANSTAQQFGVVSGAAGTVAMVVRAAASPTANITEWQSSTGAILARILNDGSAAFGTVYAPSLSNPSTGSNSLISMNAGGTKITTAVAGNITLAIQNTAGTPTANLTEWQTPTPTTPTWVDQNAILNTSNTPTSNNQVANKLYVDNAIAASVSTTEEIIPLDDISNYFDGAETRFVPRYQGDQVSILNPLRLLLTINGIIQYVNNPEYVWMSGVPQRGFFVDSDGQLQFSEAVPAGSEFDARIMSGNATTTRTRVYPFKPLDILLGG